MKKEECYEVVKIYDFFDVMKYMNKKYKKDFHDVMFEMISHSDQEGKNDSVHRLYRHNLRDYSKSSKPSNHMQILFDLICKEFEIPHDIEDDGEDTTLIYFWVSW